MTSGPPEDLHALRQQIGTRRGKAIEQLINHQKNQRTSQRTNPQADTLNQLSQLAIKRNADTINFSRFMMKQRLVDDLQGVIDSHLEKFPKMKDQFFVGIIMDKEYSAEVVDLETAAHSVEEMSPEEARQALSNNPVGYFNSKDFTMKTPEDPAYQTFKTQLDGYFKRNADIIQYLQIHSEAHPEYS